MDRTPQTTTNVPGRTVLRSTAGLLALGGVGSAAADDDGDENDDSEPTASVTIPDQEISGKNVRVTGVSLSEEGYMSIHDISRFSGADISDVEEVDEIPERENPICGSIVGISELLSAGEYDELEVSLYTEEAPAVGEFGHFSEQSLDESQPLIAIPHTNDTGREDFVCGEDPPDDGAFFGGIEHCLGVKSGKRHCDGHARLGFGRSERQSNAAHTADRRWNDCTTLRR